MSSTLATRITGNVVRVEYRNTNDGRARLQFFFDDNTTMRLEPNIDGKRFDFSERHKAFRWFEHSSGGGL